MTSSDDEKLTLETYGEGQQARCSNKGKECNPYPKGDPRHRAWNDGWEAEDDEGNSRAKGYNA
jgi:hypothetical protein